MPGVDRRLDLRDGVLSSWGTLAVEDAASAETLVGGWMYDPVNGIAIDPGSDPGFVDALAAMLRVPDIAGRGFSFGTIFTFVGNIVSMVVNYVVDVFIPYTPALSCLGPSIYDGNGQTCENVNLACEGNVSDAREMIDDIPAVSIAFKKCMKGRGGVFGTVLVAVLSAVAFLALFLGYKMHWHVRVRERLPVMTLKSLEGDVVDLGAFRGRIVVLNFFATWCTGCLLELEEVQQELWPRGPSIARRWVGPR